MTATAKTTKTNAARKPKRAKSPRVTKPATDLKAALAASIEQVTVTTGLDGDAGLPAETIGEVVRPAKKAKAKASKPATTTAPARAQGGATLVREAGTGWFHIELDGARVGQLFKTSRKGVAFWAATARPFGHDIRADHANRQAALDSFVKLYRAS